MFDRIFKWIRKQAESFNRGGICHFLRRQTLDIAGNFIQNWCILQISSGKLTKQSYLSRYLRHHLPAALVARLDIFINIYFIIIQRKPLALSSLPVPITTLHFCLIIFTTAGKLSVSACITTSCSINAAVQPCVRACGHTCVSMCA